MVRPVVFSKWKDYGVGEVTRRLERGLILFPKRVNGIPVEDHDRATQYLKDYRMDDAGKPVKKDDHIPDALLCAILRYSKNFSPDPEVFI